MKLTKSILKQLIKEEIEVVQEQIDANSVMDNLDQKLDMVIKLLKDVREFQTGRRPE